MVDAKLPRPPFGHKLRQVVLKKCLEDNFVADFGCFFHRLTESIGIDINGPLLKTIVKVSESFGII